MSEPLHSRMLLWTRGLFSSSIGHIFVNVAGLCFIYGLNIGTGIIVARSLGPQGRGIATAIGLWQPIIASLFTFGLPTAVNIAIQKYPSCRRAITSVSAKISFVIGTFAALSGALVLPFLLTRYSLNEQRFAQFSLCIVPMALIFGVSLSSLQAQQRFVAFNILRTMPQVITLSILILLYINNNLNPYSSNIAYMLPVIFIAPLALALSRPSSGKIRSPLARELLSYGLRSYGTEVVSGLGGSVDRILVITLLSPTLVGLYLVARSLADVLMGLQQSVALVILSRSGGGSPASLVQVSSLAARLGAAITLLAGIVIGSVAGWVLPYVYGSGFEGSANIFRILILEVVCTGLSITLGQAFHTVGRPGVMSTIQLSISCCTIPLVIIGAYFGDQYGVAYAMAVVSVLRLSFIIECYRLVLKVDRPRVVASLGDVRKLLTRFRSAAKP